MMEGRKVFPYTFQEFQDHLQATHVVQNYEYITRRVDGAEEEVEIGQSRDWQTNGLRLADYFHQIYPDEEEAVNKWIVFTLAFGHLMGFKDEYDTDQLAVFSDTQGVMISMPLLKALHFQFTRCDYREVPNGDALVQAVKASAREFAKSEEPDGQ